jgi:prephenate dehydrogenase
MADFNNSTFGFIGLGLIGGSIARAIRAYWPKAKIIAYNPSPDTIQEALSDGVVSVGYSSNDVQKTAAEQNASKNDSDAAGKASGRSGRQDFSSAAQNRPFFGEWFDGCDFIFLCAPVQKNAENLREIKGHLKDDAILTDIGSTKRDILEHVEALGLGKWFIGGHPMTGSERTRYRNSKATLLENAYYIICPAKEAPQDKVRRFYDFVEGVRALPLVIDGQFHDYAVGAISHLPHVVSAALVNLVKKSDSPDAVMHAIAAGGFKDITRISSSSPEMWRQICLTNGDNIVKLLDQYIGSLEKIRASIKDKDPDSIYTFFDSARQYRNSFAETHSGALNRSYTLNVDIEDRPASLAEVVTLLAVNSVSIKNIGITHNREYQEGALHVEFYSADDLEEAREILTVRNYTLH